MAVAIIKMFSNYLQLSNLHQVFNICQTLLSLRLQSHLQHSTQYTAVLFVHVASLDIQHCSAVRPKFLVHVKKDQCICDIKSHLAIGHRYDKLSRLHEM